MRWVNIGVAAALATVCVTGCNQDTEKKKADAPVPAPTRKPGLWEQTTTITNVPPQVIRICTDAAVDATLPWWGGVGQTGACKPVASKKNADGSWEFESRCDMGAAGKTGLTGVGTGDFGSKYQVVITAITAGAAEPKMNGRRSLTNTMEWKGECPAGWSPGDVEAPGGTRINRDPDAVAKEIARAKAALAEQEAAEKAEAQAKAQAQ